MLSENLKLLSMARYRRNLTMFRRLLVLASAVIYIIAEHVELVYQFCRSVIKLLF